MKDNTCNEEIRIDNKKIKTYVIDKFGMVREVTYED